MGEFTKNLEFLTTMQGPLLEAKRLRSVTHWISSAVKIEQEAFCPYLKINRVFHRYFDFDFTFEYHFSVYVIREGNTPSFCHLILNALTFEGTSRYSELPANLRKRRRTVNLKDIDNPRSNNAGRFRLATEL